MTGIAGLNFPAFHAVEANLTALGFEVVSPARLTPPDPSFTYRDAMKADLPALLTCDAIALLPDWQKSKGATVELAVARLVGMEVLDASTGQPFPVETICQEADRLVSTDRQSVYGHPFDDFTKTGRLWAVILGLPEVTPEQVALCMAQVKVSRLLNSPDHRDSMVDACGYIKTFQLVRERRGSV